MRRRWVVVGAERDERFVTVQDEARSPIIGALAPSLNQWPLSERPQAFVGAARAVCAWEPGLESASTEAHRVVGSPRPRNAWASARGDVADKNQLVIRSARDVPVVLKQHPIRAAFASSGGAAANRSPLANRFGGPRRTGRSRPPEPHPEVRDQPRRQQDDERLHDVGKPRGGEENGVNRRDGDDRRG